MPKGQNNRKLTDADIDEIVRLYTTPLADGSWMGTSSIARNFEVRPATINRRLRLRDITIRTSKEAHHGKRHRPLKNVPQGEAPACRCGCGGTVRWNQRKNRWNAYVAGHYRRPAPYKDAAWLIERYVVRRQTVGEMASECNVGESSVTRYMERFGIKRRDASDAHAGRQAGPRNPAWKGGIAQWAYSSDWKALARSVRGRDRWTCQDCGLQKKRWGCDLHVHHIDGNKLNNDLANLVSVCAPCHKQRHRAMP